MKFTIQLETTDAKLHETLVMAGVDENKTYIIDCKEGKTDLIGSAAAAIVFDIIQNGTPDEREKAKNAVAGRFAKFLLDRILERSE